MEDLYTWRAIYEDQITHVDEAGAPHGFASVDQERTRHLLLIARGGERPSHRVDVPEGATPVFFRRRRLELAIDGQKQGTTHCIGWRRGSEAVYLFVLEDGSTLLSSDLQAA